MAIDPTISLNSQAPQFNPLGAMQQGLEMRALALKPQQIQQSIAQSQQEVAASQTQQALTQAQTVNAAAQTQGLAAASASTARDLRAKEVWGAAPPEDVMQTNDNGSVKLDPVTGQPLVDHLKAYSYMAKNGLGDQVGAFAKAFTDATTQQITNATSTQALATARVEADRQASGFTSQVVQAAADNGADPVDAFNRSLLHNQKQGLMLDAKAIDPTDPNAKNLALERAKEYAAQTMTEQEKQNLKISQQANARAQVNQQLVGADAFKAQTNEDRAARLAQTADALIDQIPTGFGQWATDKRVTYFANNPALAPVGAFIAQYAADNPGSPLDFNAPRSTLHMLAQENQAQHNVQSGMYHQQAKLTGFEAPPAAGAAPATNQAPGQQPVKQALPTLGQQPAPSLPAPKGTNSPVGTKTPNGPIVRFSVVVNGQTKKGTGPLDNVQANYPNATIEPLK